MFDTFGIFGIWREGQLFLYMICMFCMFYIFGMFLYLEGGPTIPLHFFFVFEGGVLFFLFLFWSCSPGAIF